MARAPSRRSPPPVGNAGSAVAAAAAEPAPAPLSLLRRIILVDGKKGVFISLEDADLARDDPARELAKTVTLLQGALADREREIVGLKARIAELATSVQSPDDLGAALQSAVDSLQVELSRLSNPVADFAVKEFRIETRVGIRITPLGTLEYRLAGPGERLDPEAQSQLSLTLVPVEKRSPERAALDRFLAPERPIGDLVDLAQRAMSEGVSVKSYFEANHIYTIGAFVRVAGRANLQARIVAATRVNRDALARWLDLAELLLIREIDYGLAVDMQKAGIRGMRGLRDADAEKAVAALKRTDLDAARFRRWQAIAARYLEPQ